MVSGEASIAKFSPVDTSTLTGIPEGAGARDCERVTRLGSETNNELATRFFNLGGIMQGLGPPRVNTWTSKDEVKSEPRSKSN